MTTSAPNLLHKLTNEMFNTEHGIVPGDRVESSIPEEIAINLLIYHKYCLNFDTYI